MHSSSLLFSFNYPHISPNSWCLSLRSNNYDLPVCVSSSNSGAGLTSSSKLFSNYSAPSSECLPHPPDQLQPITFSVSLQWTVQEEGTPHQGPHALQGPEATLTAQQLEITREDWPDSPGINASSDCGRLKVFPLFSPVLIYRDLNNDNSKHII